MARHLLTSARLVVNAVPSALAFSFLLTSLVVILNPDAEPGASAIAGAWLVLSMAYGVPLLAGFPLAVAAVRFFAARPLRLSWLHLKSVVWFLASGTGLSLWIYGYNLAAGGDMLAPVARNGLRRALAIMVLLWILGLATGFSAQSKGTEAGGRRFRTALALLLCVLPASMTGWGGRPGPHGAWPLSAGGASLRTGTVVVVALEGSSFSEILPLAAEGHLPAFSGLIQSGGSGPLNTIRPCLSSAAWATLSTGRLPGSHGIRDAGLYSLSLMGTDLRRVPRGILFRHWLAPTWLESRPAAAGDLLTRPQWEILDRMRVEATFVGWPLAHRGGGGSPSGSSGGAAHLEESWLQRILPDLPGGSDGEWIPILREAVMEDTRTAGQMLRLLEEADGDRPRLLAARLGGLGKVAAARGGGEEGGRDRVIDRYYEVLDGFLDRLRRGMGPEDYLLVLSPYGMEPVGGLSRWARRVLGLPEIRMGHGSGPAGVLMISGPGIFAGRQVDDLQLIDALPLTLYLLGLPVGRDMDGRLPRRLFTRRFLEGNPITFVPSYG